VFSDSHACLIAGMAPLRHRMLAIHDRIGVSFDVIDFNGLA
jgi:hypothetical protein